MLTISRLSRWSINYYNDTARHAARAGSDRQRANGGLGEYYSEGDTRTPTWLVAGDTARAVELVGLDGRAVDGGSAVPEVVQRWLDEGIAPNGAAGRALSKGSVHGFDLTFAAPKSVSLLRGLTTGINDKAVSEAHRRAVDAAMNYLHRHAGYTRVHNPVTGMKHLQRLPGLVAIAYQHETSRCGDPHLHTHVIVPNRQARADGVVVSIDSKSLYHEAKAAGIIYQATLRHELHAERGVEWLPVDSHTGMAEIAGITTQCVKAWSQRSSQLREWAQHNLVMVDGAPSAQQLAAAQKATRPAKPEFTSWAQLQAEWRADARGLALDRAAHIEAQAARRAAPRVLTDRARLAGLVAGIDKAACTRADLVQWVGALVPVHAPGDPRALIEQIVERVGVRISAARDAHHREGHEMFTVDAVIAEEERVFELVDALDTRARLDVRPEDWAGLSADQTRAIAAIAHSPYLVQPLQAPAGAGKTHSLRALRAAAARSAKEVLVLAPTGKAVDEAMRDDAGDRGFTVAKALHLLDNSQLTLNRRTVLVVDEAAMVGTPELRRLLEATTAAGAKLVLVGDAYQLTPVKARGGMFEHLCEDLPWSQRRSEVWRMRDAAERDASLALRSGRGNRLRKAIGWYRTNDRLHTGDAVTMAADAHDAYLADRMAGKDALLVCDTWEMADALNMRLHDTLTVEGPTAQAARGQTIRVGDLIISRHNDPRIRVDAAPGADREAEQVRNGNRWRVVVIDERTNRIAAERLTDKARGLFDSDYLREHVTLGYAVTVHAAQGVTAHTAHAVIGESASRAMAYVAMSRGRDTNHAYIYTCKAGEADHEHGHLIDHGEVHQLRRGSKYAAAQYFRTIAANDERPRTMHAEAAHTDRAFLPDVVGRLLDHHDARRAARHRVWREHTVAQRAVYERCQRLAADIGRSAECGMDRDYGLEL
ncbi:AAA family ATPase [Mycobacterium szulgai]|uniref:AAA family ATPase n=1 Tax=Mycobacterium szulgai TaxID=1787 RepID=A0A1X2F6X1_MYCSZ|nr:MobF family relaxase [Mycobacterium szulgai]ORX14156.1 AAA family ATPase [Mycobacterium szulgai]